VHALEQTSRMPAHVLIQHGTCVGPLTVESGKAGNELKMTTPLMLPQGHAFSKGDWVFVTFPADGAVVDVGNTTGPSLTYEGELSGFLDRPSGMTVKIAGANRDVLVKYSGQTCRVDRAANRVTFFRQVDALKNFCSDSGKSEVGWIRRIVLASDEGG
ncbi:unnamed protein product, partial [Polarella glacialis]